MDASALAVKVRVLLCTDESHIDMHACICAGRASASAPIAPAYAKLRAAIRAAEAVRSFLHLSIDVPLCKSRRFKYGARAHAMILRLCSLRLLADLLTMYSLRLR